MLETLDLVIFSLRTRGSHTHNCKGNAGQGGEAHVDLRGLGEHLGFVHDEAQSAGAHDAKHNEEGATDAGEALQGISSKNRLK